MRRHCDHGALRDEARCLDQGPLRPISDFQTAAGCSELLLPLGASRLYFTSSHQRWRSWFDSLRRHAGLGARNCACRSVLLVFFTAASLCLQLAPLRMASRVLVMFTLLLPGQRLSEATTDVCTLDGAPPGRGAGCSTPSSICGLYCRLQLTAFSVILHSLARLSEPRLSVCAQSASPGDRSSSVQSRCRLQSGCMLPPTGPVGRGHDVFASKLRCSSRGQEVSEPPCIWSRATRFTMGVAPHYWWHYRTTLHVASTIN